MSIKTIFIISVVCIALLMTIGLLHQNGYIFKKKPYGKGGVVWMIVLCIAASIAVYVKGLLDAAPLKTGIQYILQNIDIMSLIGLTFMLLIGGGLLGGVSYLVISSVVNRKRLKDGDGN